MVVSGDQDVTALLSGDGYISYVCFEKAEDTFMIFSVGTPRPPFYVKDKLTKLEVQRGSAFFQKYKNGVSQDFEIIGGKWQRIEGLSENFLPDPGDQEISLSDTELTFTETYSNLKKTKTSHSISIRRSTLRFAETYRFPSDDNKSTENVEDTGHCVRY